MHINDIVTLPSKLLRNRSLVNRENFLKVLNYARNGELLRAFERVRQKITAFEKANMNRKFSYINDCLESELSHSLDCTVDVIIPIYNAYEYTRKCVASVYENTDTDYNLYMINDCSSDERIGLFLEGLKNSDRPIHLKKLVVLENEENVGFIKTVNKGLMHSRNHVVLLNTDTEVPYGWMSRLVCPIINDESIASVTPFSNAANICSFPEMVIDNALPEGMSVQDVDYIFRQYGGNRTVDIPTGVGFCMAMNRKCITAIGAFDVIYDKGYGEENDWCCRARKKGYRNVMVTNLYVYHKHGVSFGELASKSKERRTKENLRILTDRYPDYMLAVDEFTACDPIKDIRLFMQVIIERRLHVSRSAELVINHSLGGGATSYILRRIEHELSHKDFFIMELLPDFVTLKLTFYSLEKYSEFYFNFKQVDVFFIKKLKECLKINSIFINHLFGFQLQMILGMIGKAKLPYTFFIHDFYCVCPRYNLCKENYVYCNAEKDIANCNECLKHYSGCDNIVGWRSALENLLVKAKCVVAPSQNTVNIVKGYYPEIAIKVIEHSIPDYIQKTYSEKFAENGLFHISVLGAIGIEKGSRILYEVVRAIRASKLPIKITVIGYTDVHGEQYISKDKMFEVTGRYENTNISTLLADYRTNIVMIPSIWPETYSYTVSEAIFSGYKVVAFNIGAPADRIRSTGMGWLIDEISSQSMLSKIQDIIKEVACAGSSSNRR